MRLTEFELVGRGIYTIPEAARLTKVSPAQLYRWLRGHTYTYHGEEHASPPVVTSDIRPINSSYALSFLDLIEMRFVKAFREYGISLRAIRVASQKAQELLDRTHPFSSHKFRTDGRTILAQIESEIDDPKLLDLLTDQYKFKEVIPPYLFKGIEFSENDFAQRWWWPGFHKRIVIDPARCFGQPIVSKEGVPTSVLAKMHMVEDSVEKVSRWFEVDERSVVAAIDFESQLVA